MGCDCKARALPVAGGIPSGIVGRHWFWNVFPRTQPNAIDAEAAGRMGMAPMGVAIPFDARPFFSVEERPQRPFPATRGRPKFYIPVPDGTHSLNERFEQIPDGLVRPYCAGINRKPMYRSVSEHWRYLPIRTVVPLAGTAVGDDRGTVEADRVGAQDGRTALAFKQGIALRFPRWFTGAVDEDALIARTRRAVQGKRVQRG